MPYPRFRRSRAHGFRERRTTGGGNILVSSTTWVAVDTATDIRLDALPGDVLEGGVSGVWGNEANVGRIEIGLLVANVVRGAIGGPYTTTSPGVPTWVGRSGVEESTGSPFMHTVVDADLDSGFVHCRLLVRADLADPPKTLYATNASPLLFWVKNLGPQDPTGLV